MEAGSVAEQVAEHLSPYIGRHTARIAVKTIAARALKMTPPELTAADVPVLAKALEPVLATLAGDAAARAVIGEIVTKVGP